MNGTNITILNNLPPYKGEERLLKRRQATYDIVHEILKMHRNTAASYNNICERYWKGNARDTAANLFADIGNRVRYKVEGEHEQSVKEPQAIIAEGRIHGGDCKHYASYIVGVCEALRRKGYPIKAYYRFASYDPAKRNPYHVFAIVTSPGGQHEYWTDPVLLAFDQRNPNPVYYVNKVPPPMSNSIGELYAISGIMSRPIDGGTEYVNVGNTGGHWLEKYYGHAPAGTMQPAHVGCPGHNGQCNCHGHHHARFLPDLVIYPKQVGAYDDIGRHKAKKEPHKKHKLHIKIKPGKLLKKFGASAPRNGFLGLMKINFGGLAIKFNTALAKDSKKVEAWWQKLGGQPNKLKTAIHQGVKMYNKLHHKSVKMSGIPGYAAGDLESMVMISGLDNAFMVSGFEMGLENDYTMSGMYEDYTMSGSDYEAIGFMPEEMRNTVSVGFAPGAIPALLAAAAPVIAAAKNLLKSFGIKGADDIEKQAADADEDVAAAHNDADGKDEKVDDDGSVDHGSGVKTKVKTDSKGNQTMEMDVDDQVGDDNSGTGISKHEPAGEGGGKDITKHAASGGGLGLELHNAWDWMKEHQKYFYIGAGLLLGTFIVVKLVKHASGPKPKRRK